MRAWACAFLLIAFPVGAEAPEVVNVPRETLTQLLQQYRALQVEEMALQEQVEHAKREQATCLESRTT